jgi:hypothetical protein
VRQIDVLVATESRDLKADGIAAAVAACRYMTLAANRVLTLDEADALLRAIPPTAPCAVVIVGLHSDTQDVAEDWLSARHSLVVLRVDVIDDLVLLAARDVGLDSLLAALRSIVREAVDPAERYLPVH